MKEKLLAEEFAEIYKKYYRKCYFFTKSYVHDHLAAEDIVSEALVKLYEKMQEETIANIPAYLLTLLKNYSLDFLRKKVVRDRLHKNSIDIDNEELYFRIETLEECDPNALFSKEIEELIEQTIAQLSPQTRKIFILSRYENLSNKEIAEKMGVSVKGIEYHITKALTLFRKNLKDYLPFIYFLFIH